MERKLLSFIIIVFCLIGLISCEERVVSFQMKEFMEKTVVIPDSMVKIQRGDSIKMVSGGSSLPTLVIYVDGNSCTSCKINNLAEYIPLFEISKESKQFDIKIIFSPREGDYKKVKRELIVSGFEYPVYLDRVGDFYSLNKNAIPDDKRFHTFLLNMEKKPIYVGDPLLSDRLWRIFLQILEINL